MKTLSDFWYNLFIYTGSGFVALALINQLIYTISLRSSKSRSVRYRYASENETKSLGRSVTFIAFGIAFFAYFIIGKWVVITSLYHYVSVGFFSMLIAFAIGYGFSIYIQFYYPFILEKKLVKIRFTPMISPNTGKEMRLLNEDEEDVHLTEEMRLDEDAMSADYDVWLDEETGFKVIEKYDVHYHSLICEECHFRTMTEENEELTKEPTENEPGELIRHYKCSYCGHHHDISERIASNKEEREFRQANIVR